MLDEELPSISHPITDFFRKLRCKIFGHQMTRDRWISINYPEDNEWHIGCRRCPLFWTEPIKCPICNASINESCDAGLHG